MTAVLLLPFLVLVGTGGARASFFCREAREVRARCCCPPAERPDTPAVKDACCCDVKTVRAPAPDPRLLSDVTAAPAPVAVVVAVVAVAAPVAILRPIRDAHPPVGPPLILAKQSFLL